MNARNLTRYRSPGAEVIEGRRVRIYDNRGATFDRYTVVYLDCPEGRGLYACLGMSTNPRDPQGFGQHGVAHCGPHLGKRIQFDALPEECQEVVMEDLQA